MDQGYVASRRRARSSCSTKPTGCSTWASSTTCAASSPRCRASGRTLLFSATMPPEIQQLAAPHPDQPGPRRGHAGRDDRRDDRRSRCSTSTSGTSGRCCSTCWRDPSDASARWSSRAPSTARTSVASSWSAPAFGADAIHGNKSQNARERALERFKRGADPRAGRDRHRRARHRRRRHHPRHQLRPAARARRATSIASAARRAPARRASRSRSATPRSARTCATSNG